MFDRQNKGTINFEDFGLLWKYVTDWQACFRSFDRDNSGSIDRQALRNALNTFGYRLTEPVHQMIFRKFDRSGDGKVYFDDFIQCCVVLQVNLTRHFSIIEFKLQKFQFQFFEKLTLELNGSFSSVRHQHGRPDHDPLRTISSNGTQHPLAVDSF